jgi:hypothetical protein
MSDPGSSLLFPATVRRQVLEQHATLRTLLQEALEQTTRCLQHQLPNLHLTASAKELHRRFHAHLTFEERALAPILAVMDLWGPERVAELLAEHGRQRAELDILVEGIEGDCEMEPLALTLRSLAADLLRDMDEEEQGCLAAEQLREEIIRPSPGRI